MKQRIFSYNIVLKKEPKGGYTVVVPTLPGCVTYGKNLEEAKEMAEDAIKAYIASLQKHGESIPSDEEAFMTTLFIPTSGPSKKVYA